MFNFSINGHGDVILDGYNLGYNYTLKLPFMPWIYAKQMSKENPVGDFQIPRHQRIILPTGLESELSQIINLSKITLGTSELTEKLTYRLFAFQSGNFSSFYRWQIGNTLDLYEHHSEKNLSLIYSLTPQSAAELTRDYFSFVIGEPRLSEMQPRFFTIIYRLKRV